MVSRILCILAIIWQLPQFLLGLIIRIFFAEKKVWRSIHIRTTGTYIKVRFYYWKYNSGLSLSTSFRFINENASTNTAMHETGHSYQSLYLGPLYLIVIGLPSLIWNLLHQTKYFKNLNYYAFYTEKWADKLGLVKR